MNWFSRVSRTNPNRHRNLTLQCERLQERQMLTALVVNSVDDNLTPNDGQVTLREAIVAANTDATTDLGAKGQGVDTIKFELGAGKKTIRLTMGELHIQDALNIVGGGENRLTISGEHASRVFRIDGVGTDVSIDQLSIASGRAAVWGGGILNQGRNLQLNGVTLRDNVAFGVNGVGAGLIGNDDGTAYGGAIFNFDTSGQNQANLEIQDSHLIANRAIGALESEVTANGLGGAIFSFAAGLTATNTTFRENMAIGGSEGGHGVGGAIANYIGKGEAIASRFIHNKAIGGDGGGANGTGVVGAEYGLANGGALTVNLAGEFVIRETLLADNEAQAGDGGTGVDPPSTTDVGTVGVAGGGAVHTVNGSTVNISDSTIRGNRAVGGNHATAPGGIVGTAVGGGVNVVFGSSLAVTSSRIYSNRAIGGDAGTGEFGSFVNVAGGGGIAGLASTINVQASRLVGNQAIGGNDATAFSTSFVGIGLGGAIQNIFGSSLTVDHSVIAANVARGGQRGTGIAIPELTPAFVGEAWGGGIGNALGVETEFGFIMSSAAINQTSIRRNQALGGSLSTGAGAAARGGGVANLLGSWLQISESDVMHNKAKGGSASDGAPGGDATGGGIHNDAFSAAQLSSSYVIGNRLNGGLGSPSGMLLGSGIFNLGQFFVDPYSESWIRWNRPTNVDDVFGELTPLDDELSF